MPFIYSGEYLQVIRNHLKFFWEIKFKLQINDKIKWTPTIQKFNTSKYNTSCWTLLTELFIDTFMKSKTQLFITHSIVIYYYIVIEYTALTHSNVCKDNNTEIQWLWFRRN